MSIVFIQKNVDSKQIFWPLFQKILCGFGKKKKKKQWKRWSTYLQNEELWPELREDTTFVPILKEWDAKQNVMKIEDK